MIIDEFKKIMKMNNSLGTKYPLLLAKSNWCESVAFNRALIKEISFVDSFDNHKSIGIDLSWDVSISQDKSINAYLFDNKTKIIIAGNGRGKIKANSSLERMFANFSSLETINGLNEMLDTSNVIDMNHMFFRCVSLKKLDLSSFDVSKVENFCGTFCCGDDYVGNAKLKSLNIKGWNVSSATNMSYMFYGCGNLKQIDISSWNTSKVTNFRHTFADCFKLKKIDASKLNTSLAITLDGIFNDCKCIKSIDVSSWNTSSCKEFDQMFEGCISLKKIIGLEKLNTSSGISFEEMFYRCKKIKELNLSSIDTRNVDNHEFIAYNSSIKSISNMKKILNGCNNLKKLLIGPNFIIPTIDKSKYEVLEKISKDKTAKFIPSTNCMWPLLRQNKDIVTLEVKKSYYKNDIVLFKSDHCIELTIKKIKRVIPLGYIVCGYNDNVCEFIFKENVFANVKDINRNKKTYICNSLKYKLFSLMCKAYIFLHIKQSCDK